MSRHELISRGLGAVLLALLAPSAGAQSFRVQCPTTTITHPDPNQAIQGVPYNGPTPLTCSVAGGCTPANNVGYLVPAIPTANLNGAIKCQQISGGDGYITMADGTQTFMFAFGPLSGLADIMNGKPGTETPDIFNTIYPGTLVAGDPATTAGASDNGSSYIVGTPSSFTYNGAVGLTNDLAFIDTIYDISEGCNANLRTCVGVTPNTVTVILNAPSSFKVGDKVTVAGTGAAYDNAPNTFWTVSAVNIGNTIFSADQAFQFIANFANGPDVSASSTATVASLPGLTGHVDPRPIIDVGVMNGNLPAPLMAFDEDDEFFLTLTNVGMIMRPDLFEQHTVHFHGYPNASSFYDGVPDASVAINIGASFTYYYLAPDAGTYFWHCHITPPEHLQMGMVGQLYVRPRQNRVPQGASLYTALQLQDGLVTGQVVDLRTKCDPTIDILCSTNVPAVNTLKTQGLDKNGTPQKYAYNDGDGSTAYDVEYPLQIHGFDPNFHFVGQTFNPEAFVDMKDKYFLLNGRSYPDTVNASVQLTQSSDGRVHYSQPMPSIVNIPSGGKALLRIADLSVSEYATLASLGIRMHVVGYNAKLLRDQAGNNTDYYTNSITLGGGESLDVILDACQVRDASGNCTTAYAAGSVFYLYTPMLDHLSNDAENFGGLMTEIHVN